MKILKFYYLVLLPNWDLVFRRAVFHSVRDHALEPIPVFVAVVRWCVVSAAVLPLQRTKRNADETDHRLDPPGRGSVVE